MTSDPVIVLIQYRARPGREETATRELASLIATVVASEPACSGITMLQDAADPTRILLHERWTDRDAYLGPHMQTPHIQAFIQKAGEFMAGPPEISFWNTISAA
jgi:quinol monooxygenase YgiN